MTVRDRPGYFLRCHEARKLLRFVRGTLEAGRRIQITTMTRSTVYSPRHADLFRVAGTEVQVRQGARWVTLGSGRYEHAGRVHSTLSLSIRAVA